MVDTMSWLIPMEFAYELEISISCFGNYDFTTCVINGAGYIHPIGTHAWVKVECIFVHDVLSSTYCNSLKETFKGTPKKKVIRSRNSKNGSQYNI